MLLTAAERETMRQMRTVERLSILAISRRLHRRTRLVRAVLVELGAYTVRPVIPPGSRGVQKPVPQRMAEAAATAAPIVALVESGYSWSAAAEALGLTKNQVAGRMWRAGYCEPRGPEPGPRICDVVAQMPVGGCHYIAGDSRDLRPDMHCGLPVVAHGLCAEHAALCWVRAPAPKVHLLPIRRAA